MLNYRFPQTRHNWNCDRSNQISRTSLSCRWFIVVIYWCHSKVLNGSHRCGCEHSKNHDIVALDLLYVPGKMSKMFYVAVLFSLLQFCLYVHNIYLCTCIGSKVQFIIRGRVIIKGSVILTTLNWEFWGYQNGVFARAHKVWVTLFWPNPHWTRVYPFWEL